MSNFQRNFGGGGGNYNRNDNYGGQNQGGFIPDNNNSPSQTDSPKKGRSYANQTLIPLTIRQLYSARQVGQGDDAFSVDDRELSQVVLVGSLLNPESKVTHFSFILDDGTGQINVRIWLDGEDANDPARRRLENIQDNAHVRVVGNLRAFSNERNIVAYRVTPLDDANEIACHHLEVIHQYLVAQNPGMNQPQQNNFFNNNNQGNNFNNNYNNNNSNKSYATGNMTDLQRSVLQLFENHHQSQPNDPAGLNINQVCNQLKSRYSPNDVRGAVEFLQSEAHLFSTIDDNHFKVAAGSN